jgi:hypothetical protein
LPIELQRSLNNTFIQATIVKTDDSQESLEAVYQVFERLNSGGTVLTPHEIRVALYAGPFIDWLTKLNNFDSWRRLYGPKTARLRDQELVLRIVALYVTPGTYKRPLKKYLNDFVGANRYMRDVDVAALEGGFELATKILLEGPGANALRVKGRQVNAALTEATIVGLMRRLDAGDAPTPEQVATAVARLVSQPDVGAAISRATADEESVRTRLGAATRIFAAI